MRFRTSLFLLVSLFSTGQGRAADDPPSEFRAIDFSLPTQQLVDDNGRSIYPLLKGHMKIETVIRYYDEQCETLSGKTLSSEEAKAVISAGLKLAVVFQHHNDDPTKFFQDSIGVKDATRALFLADQLHQPYGSAIYFGVDGPERHILSTVGAYYKKYNGQPMPAADEATYLQRSKCAINSYHLYLDNAMQVFGTKDPAKVDPTKMYRVFQTYFNDIKNTFAKYAEQHGGKTYKIGMYCTADVCSNGKSAGLAAYYWLSAEGRDDDKSVPYDNFIRQNSRADWALMQSAPVLAPWDVGGKHVEFDFNYVNPKHNDYGQWGEFREGPPR